MENGQDSYPGFGKEAPIASIQPGCGWGMRLELAWGRGRHWVLRTFFPKYIAKQAKQRQGSCANCPGRPLGCSGSIIDSRDLKYFSNVCGYSFPPEQDRFAWRGKLPFARWGLSELIAFTVVCIVASVIVGWLAWFGAPSWLIWALSVAIFLFWLEIVWFFRNPTRAIPNDVAAIVSPADGTIVELAEVDAEGFPGNRAFRVGIFLSVFNVHINRGAAGWCGDSTAVLSGQVPQCPQDSFSQCQRTTLDRHEA
ncbi:MAG: phosphatidylserine decarboxylase [Gemmatales bacterium]